MDQKQIPEMKARWDRELSPEELARMTADPYSFLKQADSDKVSKTD